MLLDSSENSDYIKNHLKLIEKTCEFDRGIESVLCCDKETLARNVEGMKIESVDEFKK